MLSCRTRNTQCRQQGQSVWETATAWGFLPGLEQQHSVRCHRLVAALAGLVPRAQQVQYSGSGGLYTHMLPCQAPRSTAQAGGGNGSAARQTPRRQAGATEQRHTVAAGRMCRQPSLRVISARVSNGQGARSTAQQARASGRDVMQYGRGSGRGRLCRSPHSARAARAQCWGSTVAHAVTITPQCTWLGTTPGLRACQGARLCEGSTAACAYPAPSMRGVFLGK